MAFWDFLRARCPSCHRRGLRWKGGAMVSYLPGHAGPPSYSLYLCPSCDGRFRQDLGGPIVPADPEQWRLVVETRPTVELV